MLPAVVEEAIREVAEDRTSGASKLARLAVETMGLAIVDAKGRPDPKELAEVARRISEAQPAMAIVHNVAHLVARLVSEGHDPKAVLVEIQTELDHARERIARTFLKVVPPHATIVTLKFDARYDVTSWPGLLSRGASGPPKADEGTSTTYRDFEITPAHLVTMLITERGSYTPEVVRTMLSTGRDRGTRKAGETRE